MTEYHILLKKRKMAFYPATMDGFVQKGQILKRHTRSSQTLSWLKHKDRRCVGLSPPLLLQL